MPAIEPHVDGLRAGIDRNHWSARLFFLVNRPALPIEALRLLLRRLWLRELIGEGRAQALAHFGEPHAILRPPRPRQARLER